MEINYQIKLEIDTTPSASPTWAELMEGIKNLAPALNEVIYQASYLSDAGWGSSEVTGGQFTVTLTGDRIVGNAAQDYIFSSAVQYGFGDARKTSFRITQPNGRVIIWPITLANITDGGGDSNQPNAITIAIHGNGRPTITGTDLIGDLTVVSVAGTLAGDTAVYVNPALGGGNTYVYKTAPSVALPTYNQSLTTGWTAWDGSADITATTGNQIVVAEITAGNLAVKAGKATVTSHA